MTIIFDNDGTLRSLSWEGLFAAYQAIITALGRQQCEFFENLKEFKAWFSWDWRVNVKRIGNGNSKKEFLEEVNSLFHQIYDPYIKHFPWTKVILDQLVLKHKLALLTTSNVSSAIGLLEKYELRKFFAQVVGNEQVKNIKPDPEGIFLILDQLDIKADGSTIIVGDTALDILAGKAAGIKTGLVLWREAKDETEISSLLSLSPDYVFEKPEDLLKLSSLRK